MLVKILKTNLKPEPDVFHQDTFRISGNNYGFNIYCQRAQRKFIYQK